MLIPRKLPEHIRELCAFFPAISLTGPRQAGKTTLLKQMFPDYKYVSLENPKARMMAQETPEAFLAEYNDKVIFDEAQRWPDLFSWLQGIIDDDRRPGRFILSGSQNFLMRKSITQSLAGRIGICRLLSLDNRELKDAGRLPDSFQEAILQGGYPGLVGEGYPRDHFFDSYISSYIERDVSELVAADNLDLFRRFLQICATYSGQAINLAKISRSVGVSSPTVRSWIGILEQSYVIFRLQPFYRNLGKRLTKASKLYFYDTGLLCHLLGLMEAGEIDNYSNKGALFENLVVADAMKSFYHQGLMPRLNYYRDSNQLEVDLIYEKGNLTRLWEIKTSENHKYAMVKTLENVATFWDRPTETNLIYTGDEEHLFNKSMLINWRNLEWKR